MGQARHSPEANVRRLCAQSHALAQPTRLDDQPLTHGNSAEPSPVEGFPMRSWSIEIWLLDDAGNEVMPNVFEKAVYNLHPSFEKNKHGECADKQCAGQGQVY
jgi:hypothetical protein